VQEVPSSILGVDLCFLRIRLLFLRINDVSDSSVMHESASDSSDVNHNLTMIWCLFFACLVSAVDAAPPPLAFTPLWPIQVASAAASYMGLVVSLDRPRGTLEVGPDDIEVAPSQVVGAGLGLYCAASSLRKGTILGTYPGAVIPLEQNLGKLYQYPCCETYIWRFSDSKMVIDPTDAQGQLQDVTYGGNPSTFGSMWICKNILGFLSKPITLCRVNEPPVGRDRNVKTNEDLDKRTITFLLERDVYQGEELFLDYGPTYDRSNYGPPK
jgi:hypothetical protein